MTLIHSCCEILLKTDRQTAATTPILPLVAQIPFHIQDQATSAVKSSVAVKTTLVALILVFKGVVLGKQIDFVSHNSRLAVLTNELPWLISLAVDNEDVQGIGSQPKRP